MKIGIYDPYLDTLGGGEKYMLTAAACLAKEHEVTIFWDNPEVAEAAKQRFGLNLSSVSFSKNIFNTKIPLWERIFQSMQYDRIFYLSDGSIPVAFPKKLFLHFQFPLEWVKGKSLSNALKMQHIAGVICNSEFTKKFIDKTFGINSTILYPPSTGEFKKDTAVKKENIILTVGRYGRLADNTSFKKQEFMIETFKKMIKKGLKQWKFILVISFKEKDKEYVDELEKSIKGFPIEIIKNADSIVLQNVYRKAKIYWHAAGFGEDLEKHPELAEHFGIATVQAMEQGAVPVVLNAGGQKEIITNKENGLLWNSQEECIEKTENIIKDKKLWEKLSRNAEIKADEFTVNTFCQNLSAIMQ